MNERTKELAEQAGWDMGDEVCRFTTRLEKFAELVRAEEREVVLEAVEALTGMEVDRHKMFSEGYDYALYHIRQVVEGRST